MVSRGWTLRFIRTRYIASEAHAFGAGALIRTGLPNTQEYIASEPTSKPCARRSRPSPPCSLCCPAACCAARLSLETRKGRHSTQRSHNCTSTGPTWATRNANRLESSAKTMCASPSRASNAPGGKTKGGLQQARTASATLPFNGEPDITAQESAHGHAAARTGVAVANRNADEAACRSALHATHATTDPHSLS